jgi:hypothetical protein
MSHALAAPVYVSFRQREADKRIESLESYGLYGMWMLFFCLSGQAASG